MSLSLLQSAEKEDCGIPMNELNIVQLRKERLPKEIAAEAYSIIGHRKTQQDFAGTFAGPDRVLAVLCDGMGGLMGGERASREAAGMLLKDYETKQPSKNFADFLCREAVRMDSRVHGLKSRDGRRLDAGTTAVAVVVSKDGTTDWMSVGDSRIYLLRGDSLKQLTRDQNYRCLLEDSLRKGEITQEHYDQEIQGKMAEALTSYLGMGNIKKIGRSRQGIALKPGDQILLCSDGLYKSLSSDQIKAMLIDNQIDARVSVRRLADMALAKAVKKQDNTTVVLIQYHGKKTEE